MSFLGVGIALQADIQFLEWLKPMIESECDFFEVTTETLWTTSASTIVPNAFHSVFQEIQQRAGKPFVAHGLNYSPGTALTEINEQRIADQWLAQYHRDQGTFAFQWISEHLGYTRSGGLNHSLPLPLPPTHDSSRIVANKMQPLLDVNPLLALETSVQPYLLGTPQEWITFLANLCDHTPCALVLDLHNLYTDSQNFGFDPFEVLQALNGDLVVEIHVSGGSLSNPRWVSSGRPFRLDSHDGLIPQTVMDLLTVAIDQCPNLRGVVWERLNGTFGPDDVPTLRSELQRVREIVAARKAPAAKRQTSLESVSQTAVQLPKSSGGLMEFMAQALRGGRPSNGLELRGRQELEEEARLRAEGCPEDALELAALMVAKLRMERLSSGHAGFRAMMAQAPAEASAAYQRYAHATQPSALWPEDEAELFEGWRLSAGI